MNREMRYVYTITLVDGVWEAGMKEHPKRSVEWKDIHEVVDGFIERVSIRVPELNGELDLWVNEEGLLHGLPMNPLAMMLANHEMLVGNALVCRATSGGDSVPLSLSEATAIDEAVKSILGA